ncbi:YybH family protein [Sphingosinicella terrae]|uniref:YybH family protein n=1 Tax=Sphingosinicella terrae TaxID=2172047 RepID=UPI0013B433BF|nr:nuclear transport factor 2 family protein [Sphingosinicella terrae]
MSSAAGASGLSFEDVVENHVAAVTARDLDALVATVTHGDRLLLIFPDGRRTDSRSDYLAFHRDWFADPGWTMEFERIALDAGAGYGHALYLTTFDQDGSGPQAPRSSWLSLGFRLERGQWRLVHDQNTRIAAAQ